jgi:hypothetical protein
MDEPKVYEIRIEGRLAESWSSWFEGMIIRQTPCGQTTLRGTVIDQAALYGLLNKIQGLNLTLVSVNRVA